MSNWEIYIRTTGGHCEFWSVELDSSGRSTTKICFGRLGTYGRIHNYDSEAIVDNRRRDKLSRGYTFFGKRKYSSPRWDEVQNIPCVIQRRYR